MKKILLTLCSFTFVFALSAQTIVSTTPQNKKVILEEFTGTGCPNCPGGHTAAAGLLTANAGNLFVVAYHPTNSSYTTGDPMARAFPAAFYSTPFISPSNRFMPSAIIGRRIWGGVERIQGVGSWTSDCAAILGESSPLNVGVSSTYNTGTKILTVNIEVYFTANVTNALTFYTVITEDGIIANQSGGTSSYVHNHAFREALPAPTPGQWGETISSPTTQGTTKSFTYTFNNSTANYDMSKCEIIAFVRDASNEEVISGNGAPVGSSSLGVSAEKNNTLTQLHVSPNPINETSSLGFTLTESSAVRYEVYDILGNKVTTTNLDELQAGVYNYKLDTETWESGVYFISITTGTGSSIVKIVK